MNILEKSSMILLKIGSGKEYKKAKEECVRIKRSCIDEEKSIIKNFERVLEERKLEIDIETYIILKKNVKEIIINYKRCLEGESKEIIGLEYKKEIECAICLGSHKRKEVLYIEGCNHEFGKECIKEWLKVGRECPLCRRKAENVKEYREKAEEGWIEKVKVFLSIK
jgi:hypothetical protein